MLKVKYTSKFKKDYKLAKRQGKNPKKLEAAIIMLCNEEMLPESMHDHELVGNYHGHRECHLEPDWILIYRVDYDELVLTAVRTGSHAALFDYL